MNIYRVLCIEISVDINTSQIRIEFAPQRFSRACMLSGGGQAFLSPFEIQILLSRGASTPQRQIQTLNDREVSMDFSNLNQPKVATLKCQNQFSNGIINFQQKILFIFNKFEISFFKYLKKYFPLQHLHFFNRKKAAFYYSQLEIEIGAQTHSRKPLWYNAAGQANFYKHA